MKLIKVGAASLNQIPFNWEHNKKNILEAIYSAKKQNVSILCLPELCITGYGCEDAFFFNGLQSKALSILKEICDELWDNRSFTHNFCVNLGLPLHINGALYNTACFIVDGEIVGFVPKKNLAADGIHYEPRWFKPWDRDVVINNIGDFIFDLYGIKIGFEICEDAWVANRPGINLSKQGVHIILNPSASHFAFNRHSIRKQFVLEGSRAFRCAYVYSNLVGNESGRIIYDGDCIIASCGKLIAEGRRLSFKEMNLTTATIDIDEIKTQQIQSGELNTNNFITIKTKKRNFTPPVIDEIEPPIVHNNPKNKYSEFTEAVTLGLYDYMRKSKSKGYVISLSGGADSAACAYLVKLMCNRTNLNIENILTCIYQSSENSSLETYIAAKLLSDEIGAKFLMINLSDIIESYSSKIEEKFLSRKLDWEKDDIALQNIQARARAPSAWMVANLSNSLLITTSNRSEAAVGYATMDGDTAGGIAPIAGIDKNFLIDWLKYISEKYNSKALKNILGIKPTAELRPTEQYDENDLMPYDILDRIEREAIHKKRFPEENFTSMKSDFEIDDVLLKKHIDKFYKLWCTNQWKRERYAASFHLDDANLDPKTWCRFPILNGGIK